VVALDEASLTDRAVGYEQVLHWCGQFLVRRRSPSASWPVTRNLSSADEPSDIEDEDAVIRATARPEFVTIIGWGCRAVAYARDAETDIVAYSLSV